jgi:hypothetical protein
MSPKFASSTICKRTVLVLTVLASSMASMARLHASCGDHLRSLGHSSLKAFASVEGSGLSKAIIVLGGKRIPAAPLIPTCVTCQGGAVPISPPITVPTLKIEVLAILRCDASANNGDLRRPATLDPASYSEGSFPSLLRPPIA